MKTVLFVLGAIPFLWFIYRPTYRRKVSAEEFGYLIEVTTHEQHRRPDKRTLKGRRYWKTIDRWVAEVNDQIDERDRQTGWPVLK